MLYIVFINITIFFLAQYEILYYLNNHRGGFFKFFSEPEPEHHTAQQQQHYGGNQEQGGSTFLSILNALTGNSDTVAKPTPTTSKPVTQAPPADITSGIGSFFTQLLSNYIGGDVEYQRRRRRRRRSLHSRIDNKPKMGLKFEDASSDDYDATFDVGVADDNFHDEEDSEDTAYPEDYASNSKDKILFPENAANIEKEIVAKIIKKFNDLNKSEKLKFPKESGNSNKIKLSEEAEVFSEQADSNKVTFEDDDEDKQTVLPDRKQRILNRPTESSAFSLYSQPDYNDDKLVLSNDKRPNSYRYEIATDSFNSLSNSASSHTKYSQSSYTQNNYYQSPSSVATNSGSNYFLPTPTPEHSYQSSNNNFYSNQNQNSQNSYYQKHSYNSPSFQRPQYSRPPKTDDKNIYVTNAQGKTEYYITEDGRKVYL